MKHLLLWLLLLSPAFSFGQKRKSPKCPPAARSSNEYFQPAPEQWFLKTEAGMRHSMRYNDIGGHGDSHFHFISKPQPYISFISGYAFDRHWGIFLGALATQTTQGLQFRLETDGSGRRDNIYRGCFQFRFPLGATYSFSRWKSYLAPVLTYNSFFSTEHYGGAFQAGNASPLSYSITWPQSDSYDQWNMGLDAGIERKIAGRFYASFSIAVDFYPSVSSSAAATVQLTATQYDVYYAKVQPYLWYIGLGLNYRLFSDKSM